MIYQLNNYPEHKEITQRAQAEYDRKKRISVKVGYRVYTFATGCRCGHLHLIADGGATLNACGGDCSAHFYESRTDYLTLFSVGSKWRGSNATVRVLNNQGGRVQYIRIVPPSRSGTIFSATVDDFRKWAKERV